MTRKNGNGIFPVLLLPVIAGCRHSWNTSAAFDTIDTTLKEELDPLIELIKGKDNNLYQQYHAVRKIKDLGSKHNAKTAAPAAWSHVAQESMPVLAG